MSTPLDLDRSQSTRDDRTASIELQTLQDALSNEHDQRRKAECMAEIQRDAVQLALDLLVREPDVAGFFRAFMKRLVDDSESHACGVWLLDETSTECHLWMAIVEGQLYTKDHAGWDTLALPRAAMGEHLKAHRTGWTEIVEYEGQDPRLPETVRDYHRDTGINSLIVAPLALPTRSLGWVALANGDTSECEQMWRRALVDAMAGQATLALHHSRLAEQSRLEGRRQAVLEERNRIARDIHDTLAQGFAAILMQLQAAQRAGAGAVPSAVSSTLDTAVELARTHMIEARRSVSALRPTSPDQEDVAAALERLTGLARRTSGVPIDLCIEALPQFVAGVEREIIGIAQEALTNAISHARARHIRVHAGGVRSVGFRLSVADDGRGFAADRGNSGFGMTSMRERAERIGASLTIVTAPRAGTEVVLAWEPPSFSIPRGGDVVQ